jgi:amino-acid N-acetyltransferase
MQINTSDFVQLFRTAAPYIHAHRGKTFVIKLPGEVMQNQRSSHLVYDLALLNSLGVRVVIVYGARPQIENRLKSAGIDTEFNDDLRVTDQAAMEYVKEAVGALGLEIKARLSMSLGNTPMADACVRVATGNYIIAKPLGVRAGVDYQYTGKIRSINTDSINKGLDNNEIVLIPPIGYSSTGEVFNLGSDEVTAEMAISLKADKLIFITDEQNLVATGGKLTHQLTESEAEKMTLKRSNRVIYSVRSGHAGKVSKGST